jgi:MFS family permease
VVSVNAPAKLSATAQGLLSGFYEGLGTVTGTLIGGFLYDSYGPKVMFTGTSIALFISWGLFLALQFSRYFTCRAREEEVLVVEEDLKASKLSVECVQLDDV